MKKDVKTHLHEHSKAKIDLLGKYIDRYINIISNDKFTHQVRIYDLFCGEGVYENNGHGSPITLLKCVKNLHYINKAKNNAIPRFYLKFNDFDSEKIEKLKTSISSLNLYYPEFGEIAFTTNDYLNEVEELSKILPALRGEKAFIFIDPYGYKHIKASQIRELLKNKNSEVLLWLPTQFMYRFENDRPVALQDFLGEIVNYQEWTPNTSVWEFVKQLLDGFKEFMGDEYFVDNFTIQKDSNTVFCLYFFSSHIKGFEKMLEAKWEIDTENGKGWTFEKTISLFASTKHNWFEGELIRYIKSKPRTNSEIYYFCLKKGHLPTHCNDILGKLQEQDLLRVVEQEGKMARKKAFYINYENYKNQPNRVTFKHL